MKEVYEVFRKGTFIAVVKPRSRAAKKLWARRSTAEFRGDIRAEEIPFGAGRMDRLGLIEQAGQADVWEVHS